MENSVWARRSVFDLDNALLLVMEVFLPDLPEYPRISISEQKSYFYSGKK